MKFGKSIGSQQYSNTELHYVDYKLLKKRIKDVVSCQQNHELADELQTRGGAAGSSSSSAGVTVEPLAAAVVMSSSSSPSSRRRPEDFRTLVGILRDVDQLRKYAVWNAVAVVKILKKRRKQTNFGLEDTAAERAGWLSRQSFFSGSDFAELHAAIESLGHMLVLSELAPGDGSALQPREQKMQQCPICLDVISDMVELSCNHRFCWKCFVLGPIAHQPGEYRITQCPICRKETTQTQSLGDGGDARDDTSGICVPSSEGLLTRFLHTYFPQENCQQESFGSEDGDDEQEARREGEQSEREMRDVVGELIKALLADESWQRPAKAAQAATPQLGDQAASSSTTVPTDFFQTLPPEKSQHEKQLLSAAQKLQWVQLASTGDPLVVDGMAYCSLCSEPLLMEAVVTTPCKHHFHKVCISRVDVPECPLCSTNLPFSWFLPADHHCAEHGFRVVSSRNYKPDFPGGPSRGSCGYPLRQPPSESLYARGGLVMKSYLHRIPPTGDPEESPRSNVPTLPTSPVQRAADTPEGGSSASESSSDESGSEEGDDGPRAASRKTRERSWAYGSCGRIRLVPNPPPFAAKSGSNKLATPLGQTGPQAETASSEKNLTAQTAGPCGSEQEQRNPTVLLIGNHL